MLLINIWIFIPLLVYRWGVEGVTEPILMGYDYPREFKNKPCAYCLWTMHHVVHMCFEVKDIYEPKQGAHEWVDVWLWP